MQLSGQWVDIFIIVIDIKWPFIEVMPIYTGKQSVSIILSLAICR